MMISTEWVVAWLIATGIAAAGLTAYDKHRARKGVWRVPERTLFLVALLGGSAAMYLTMRLIRHKTKHRRFMWGLPLLMLAQGALAWYVVNYLHISFT